MFLTISAGTGRVISPPGWTAAMWATRPQCGSKIGAITGRNVGNGKLQRPRPRFAGIDDT